MPWYCTRCGADTDPTTHECLARRKVDGEYLSDADMWADKADLDASWLLHMTHGDGKADCEWCRECGPPSQYGDD